MGPDDDRGQGRRLAQAARATASAPARNCSRSRPARSPMSSRPSEPARCAASWRPRAPPCRSARCWRWPRPTACPTPRSMPLSPASSSPSRPRRRGRGRATAAPRDFEAGGRRLRVSRDRRRRGRAGRCCCTASAPTSTPGCSISRHWPRAGASLRWTCRGMAVPSKDVGAGDAERVRGGRRPTPLAALGVERVHLVGHSMGGAIARRGGAAPARAGRVADPDRARPVSAPRSTAPSSTASCRLQRRREMQRRHCRFWCTTRR